MQVNQISNLNDFTWLMISHVVDGLHLMSRCTHFFKTLICVNDPHGINLLRSTNSNFHLMKKTSVKHNIYQTSSVLFILNMYHYSSQWHLSCLFIHAQHFNFLSVTNILTHNNPHKIIYKQTEIAIDKLVAHAFFCIVTISILKLYNGVSQKMNSCNVYYIGPLPFTFRSPSW